VRKLAHVAPALSSSFFLFSGAVLLSLTRFPRKEEYIIVSSLGLFLIGLAFLMFTRSAKSCSGCGKESEETQKACPKCGTESLLSEPVSASSPLIRGASKLMRFIALVLFIAAVVKTPALIIAIPVIAVFYSPIYLPFFLSFSVRAPNWCGLRWSLRIASISALSIWLIGMWNRPAFGNDVGGNIAGASHNIVWTWGSGIGCTLTALIIGQLLHAVHSKRK
jgi:hypothetical protein